MAAIPKDLPDLPPLLDQAILDPLLNDQQLHELCDASRQENVRAICTSLQQLPLLRQRLGASEGGPKLIAAIGFPFGALPSELKQAEAEWAASQGAEELDVVPDFRALANGSITTFADELGALCGLGLPLRVILDMARLTQDQLALAVEAAIDVALRKISEMESMPRKLQESRWHKIFIHTYAEERSCMAWVKVELLKQLGLIPNFDGSDSDSDNSESPPKKIKTT